MQVLSEGKQRGGNSSDNNGYDNINNKCPLSAHHQAHRPAHRVKLLGPWLKMQNEGHRLLVSASFNQTADVKTLPHPEARPLETRLFLKA